MSTTDTRGGNLVAWFVFLVMMLTLALVLAVGMAFLTSADVYGDELESVWPAMIGAAGFGACTLLAMICWLLAHIWDELEKIRRRDE